MDADDSMLNLGSLTFAVPAALLALLLLPALWWFLRSVPPAPQRVAFPPVRFIAQLVSTETSVQQTPWWLLVLRLILAAAIIIGIARPVLDAAPPLAGSGPVVVIVDDGWAAASDWPLRQKAMTALIDQAERENRSLVLVPTAVRSPDEASPISPNLSPDVARDRTRSMQPKPWGLNRAATVNALLKELRRRDQPPGAVLWLSDGLEEADGKPELGALTKLLRPFGAVSVLLPEKVVLPIVVRPPISRKMELLVQAVRAGGGEAVAWVDAIAANGAVLAREPLRFAADARDAEVTLTMPAELRNRLDRLEVDQQSTAAAVVLLDERWRRRPVGLATLSAGDSSLPLLSSSYYLERALEPVSEIRRGNVDDLLSRELAMLVLAEGNLPDAVTRQRVLDWVREGGVFVRFAGPSGSIHQTDRADPLLPVPLRVGDRALGGSLAWEQAAGLAPFDEKSPFYGLDVPVEVRVERQVLAEPTLSSDHETWARLDDGTPLVTAAQRKDGWVVLFHTTANAEWSNLAMSGLFVEMLERLLATSRGVVTRPGGPPLAPLETVNGFGILGSPPPEARAVAAASFAQTEVGPEHPPGFYGNDAFRRALNLSETIGDPRPIGDLPEGVHSDRYAERMEHDLRPWLLGAALLLAVIDLAASMIMRGYLRIPPGTFAARAGIALISAGGALAASSGTASAQQVIADGSAIAATLTTQLAYVITGDRDTDTVSHTGLAGLTTVVNRRTAAELGPPAGVDIENDELVFYPLIYWPITSDNDPLSAAAARNIGTYMADGGTVLFDTRRKGVGIRLDDLRQLAEMLDLPPCNRYRRIMYCTARTICCPNSPAVGPAARSGSNAAPGAAAMASRR